MSLTSVSLLYSIAVFFLFEMGIYLDNAATTKPSASVLSAVRETAINYHANPSSTHAEGIRARKKLSEEREKIASLLGVSPLSLVFTSGATESVSICMMSLITLTPGRAIISDGEHDAVRSWIPALKNLGWDAVSLPARHGIVKAEDLDALMSDDTRFVAVSAVNNVNGAVNDIGLLSEVIKNHRTKRRVFFLSDMAQALGKTNVSGILPFVDGAVFSSHKINGPMGVGALFLKNPSDFNAIAPAGGQEGGKRGGTENLPGISGFRAAVEEWIPNMEEGRIRKLNKKLREGLGEMSLGILSPENSSPYILSFSSPLPSEVFTGMLSDIGIYVSAGSACSNNGKSAKEVFLRMKYSPSDASSSVRVSFSNDTEEKDIDALIEAVRKIVNE